MKASGFDLDFTKLKDSNPKVKYGYVKELLRQAGERPAELYPAFDSFVSLLDSDNQILKWMAIEVIGELARVDSADRAEGQLGQLYRLLDNGTLITANHAISALCHIARYQPRHREAIVARLLEVEHYNYATDECRNIALGKVILALDAIFQNQDQPDAVLDFVERQRQNRRNATRKKAEQFLRRRSARR